jgi:hypothetical protein
MDTLNEAVKQTDAFPGGLFWLHRGDHSLLPRVVQLLENAIGVGIEAAIVKVDNFDEALRDITRLIQNIDHKILDEFSAERRHWSGAPRPVGDCGYPILRFNALKVEESPNVCRLVDCRIGGYTEIREAVEKAGVNALVARIYKGVLAFGSDEDIRTVFQDYNITNFDLHTIQMKRLRYDSGERGLLRDALTSAISRSRGLNVIRRSRFYMLTPANPKDPIWRPLKRLVGTLKGTIPKYAETDPSELVWHEGISTRLDWANDCLWLLFEPRVIFSGITEANKAVAADFARERTVKRYNRALNNLVGFWATLLAGDGDKMRALDVGDGVDASFKLSLATAFSRRIKA